MNETILLALTVLTIALAVYKRRRHIHIRNKKRMSCKHEIERK